MAPTVLLISAVIAAWPLGLKAHVLSSFSLCKEFFYKETEPFGIDQNAEKICQKYGFYYYASLYSKTHRIPMYSAYTLDHTCRNNDVQRKAVWFIEPQISDFLGEEDMTHARQNKDIIKLNQALNEDYENTDYDRGHLNPNSYHCNNGRTATFTLTNAVPMDACFNRVHWKAYEDDLRTLALGLARIGKSYFVTGAVPSQNRIPAQGLDLDDTGREFNRVTIPSHVWTAMCFKHDTDDTLSFSIGYIGENRPDSIIQVMSIPDLRNVLGELYSSINLFIFDSDCYPGTEKSKETLRQFKNKLHLPQIQRALILDKNVEQILSASLTKRKRRGGSRDPPPKTRVNKIEVEIDYRDMTEWFDNNEYMKLNFISSCVFQPKSNVHISWPTYPVHDDLRVVRSAEKLDNYICKLIPEKSTPESVITADGTRCKAGSTCFVGSCQTHSGIKKCCMSPCLYDHARKGFMCNSGQHLPFSILNSGQQPIRCSPQYSSMTVNGKSCRDDHQCGTYGESYYWCYTNDKDWEYCSPPFVNSVGLNGKQCRVDHQCNTYGKDYQWCYTDQSNHWTECCTDRDPYVAINGKTCKPDHKCDTYGEKYLWCYTTDGGWDYCCTK